MNTDSAILMLLAELRQTIAAKDEQIAALSAEVERLSQPDAA